ncbi:MAG: CotH kinase family protein [Fibrobacter sp.]|nr:CotH kinase family protein [Fibrobacter sp.]
MKTINYIIYFLLIVSAVTSVEAANDSSSLIFEDTQVYTYKFSFFTPDWKDSMEYYKGLEDEPYMPASMLFYNEKGDTVRFDTIGIRYKGNSSYMYSSHTPKKPIKIKIDKYNKDQTFFGVKRLNFSNNVLEPSFMREKIAYDIIRKYIPSPRTSYANIYFEDELVGFYTQIEQIDKTFLKGNFEDHKGNLFKASDNGATLLFDSTQVYDDEYELKTNEKENDWSRLAKMIDVLNNSSDKDFVKEAGKYLDLDNCIRHLAFTVVLSHFDSYTGTSRNFYLYDDPVSGKFKIIPWDLNLAFGAITNNWDVYNMDIVKIDNLKKRPLNRRIIENDSLREVYFDYLREFMDGAASAEAISVSADKIQKLIEKHVLADKNKLYTDDDFINNIKEDILFSDGFQMENLPGIKTFAENRYPVIRSQIDGYLPVRPNFAKMNKPGFIANAFNSKSGGLTIKYNVNKTDQVKVRLISLQGKTLKVLDEGVRKSGLHIMNIKDHSISSGFYAVDFSIGNVKTSIPLIIAY